MKNQVLENPVKNQREGGDFALLCVTALLITTYLAANLMAVKLINVFGITLFDAGTITFPIAYMLGDVLTEVWGFKTARRVIFLSFACNIWLVACTYIGVFLPGPEYMDATSKAYAAVFGYVPRIVLGSLLAFLAGNLINSWLLVKIRERTGKRHFWLRAIGSSVAGHLADTAIFVTVAFAGSVPAADLFSMIWIQYLVKVGIEALAGTPLAYAAVSILRKKIPLKTPGAPPDITP